VKKKLEQELPCQSGSTSWLPRCTDMDPVVISPRSLWIPIK
jgi:hypothetical protein